MKPAACLLLVLAVAWAGAGRADEPVPGWDGLRWGMTQAEIDRIHGQRLRRPAKPIRYHQSRVEAALPGVRLGGMPFVASFVLGQDGRLQQILVERRTGAVTGQLFAAVVTELVGQLGRPDLECFDGGDPRGGSLVWTGRATTIHAQLFGYSSEALRVNPSREIRRPYYVPREEYRGMPTRPRILLRYHPTARNDLFGRHRSCRPPSVD
ncbi:hypothetical protein EDC65_3006 [Stella humosa]|uniref:Uncharacterized protein n=1 Tax=Stella humosa TaxID=94 RepID=A0A3N1L8Y1_9PROT|nr:hypothetical protein [Stella humosa]ROP91143.1 hypothetical protein EDC65_3006 [Stella humosa]BBK34505.1 hypothetical protein STHU_51390 [Stella humosa]